MLLNLETEKFTTPTPVQMQVIPAALSDRDLLVAAQTGSGKSEFKLFFLFLFSPFNVAAAFLLPLLKKIWYLMSQHELKEGEVVPPMGLILAPTRELCIQIEEQAQVLGRG